MSSKRDSISNDVVLVDFFKSSGVRGDLDSFEPSLTRQEFAEECDINTIMAKYEASGVISHVNRAEPMYLDTTDYPTLQGAMDSFREAALAFNSLPAKVRREFDNDPRKFVDFASDGSNLDKMREWGLAPPPPEAPEPVLVKVQASEAPSVAPAQGGSTPAAAGSKPT